MADTKSTAIAGSQNNLVSNTAAQNAAFTLYDGDLLSYVIYLTQEKFKPNKDEGVTFYYGVVTNIIDSDTANYDKRDILHSRIDGIERVNNTTTKDNSTRNLYFVHIPSLYSILFDTENKGTENVLRQEDLYKFRVEHVAVSKTIKVGNIVKVKFENNSTFTGGIIEDIVEENILQLKDDASIQKNVKKTYQDIPECITAPIDNSNGQMRALATTVLTMKDISGIGLYDFIENFVYSYSTYVEGKFLSNVESIQYNIVVSENTFARIGQFQSSNSDFNSIEKFGISTEKKYVLAYSDSQEALKGTITVDKYNEIKIAAIDRVEGKVSSGFSKYLKQYLATNYPFEVSSEGNIIKVTLKIIGVDNEANFYAYSDSRYMTIKSFGNSPNSVVISQSKVEGGKKPSVPQEKCENDVVTIDQYINTETDNWKRKGKDEDLVNYFFKKTKLNNSSPEMQAYENKTLLSVLDVIKLEPLYPKIKLLINNPKFYKGFFSLSEENGLSEGIDDGDGYITVDKIENNFIKLKEDISALRKNICKNEGLSEEDVLILPLRWFEQKPSGSIPKNRDLNSQLWFGRAVQFVVYVRVEGKIFQVPSEIVFLYIQKTLSQEKIGVGLFTSGLQYVQYEHLGGLNLKDPLPRYWGEDSEKDNLQKKLKDVSENDFVSTVRDYVRVSYASSEKIRYLTSGN
jgi:hypothetical protein